MKKLFQGKKVLIMGLGIAGGGKGVAKFFVKQGAKVRVTDLKTKKELKESLKKLKGLKIEYILGKHRKEDFLWPDFIIKNPAVPPESAFLKIAKKAQIPIETDIGIFFKLCKGKIIGITGTKGKSTTATLIYKLLKSKEPKTILAGNIGKSPLEDLNKITKKTLVVLELSSFQLEGLESIKKSPQIAVITNIFPDHLNRYKSMAEYVMAKKLIFSFQKKNDILLLNYDDPIVRDLAKKVKSRVYFFSQKPLPPGKNPACFIKSDKIFFGKVKRPILRIREINNQSPNLLSKFLAAASLVTILKVPVNNVKKIFQNFQSPSGRQEFIKELKGVKYFNDTTATNPGATEFALKTFKKMFPDSRIILIAGGQDKKLNYNDLAKEIKKSADYLILFTGLSSSLIKKELTTIKYKGIVIDKIKSMKKAVNIAKNLAKKGDIILLSPAAASFNMFQNEFDRGEQFNREVKRLKN